MKKIYFVLPVLFLLIAGSVSGQLSLDPNPVYMDVDTEEFETIAHSFVTNESTETKSFTWVRSEMEITEGWESAVCDDNQCYAYESNTPTQSFTLAPGESGIMDVHVYPFEIEGSAIIRVTISEVGNFSNNVMGIYYFNETVSVPERLNEAITLYPNPANDHIFIGKGEKVDRIELFSLSGRQVMNAPLNTDNVVNVSHLSTGTYVARLFNAADEQVSSNVLIKK